MFNIFFLIHQVLTGLSCCNSRLSLPHIRCFNSVISLSMDTFLSNGFYSLLLKEFSNDDWVLCLFAQQAYTCRRSWCKFTISDLKIWLLYILIFFIILNMFIHLTFIPTRIINGNNKGHARGVFYDLLMQSMPFTWFTSLIYQDKNFRDLVTLFLVDFQFI